MDLSALFETARPIVESNASLRSAIQFNGKVYSGGRTHLDVLLTMPVEIRQRAILDGNNRGYVTPSGKFLDRERAAQYARKHDLFKPNAPAWVFTARELASEYLGEAVQSRMLHNASVASILGLLKRSENRALRGLVVGQDVWWWDSELALHGDVAKNTGHVDYLDDRLNLYFDHDDVRLDIPDAEKWNFAAIMQQPQLARLLRSPLIFVNEPGHGLISGPEWIDLNK